MEVVEFISNFRVAFGDKPELPCLFWYSDTPAAEVVRVNGCIFKEMVRVRAAEPLSLSCDSIGCGGGKFYTGFTTMPEHVPNFVSTKERYKQSPDMVVSLFAELAVPRAAKPFLNFARLDMASSFEGVEGVIFFATPDMLSGLTTWAFFDNNDPQAVSSLFGSGCCEIVTRAVLENQRGGSRTFLGLLDPSARQHFEPGVLSYLIPMSRFRIMYHTMRSSCLFDTHAWERIRTRINR